MVVKLFIFTLSALPAHKTNKASYLGAQKEFTKSAFHPCLAAKSKYVSMLPLVAQIKSSL